MIYKLADFAKKGAGGLVTLIVDVVRYPGCVELKPLDRKKVVSNQSTAAESTATSETSAPVCSSAPTCSEEGITEEEAEVNKELQQSATSGGQPSPSFLLGSLLTNGLGLLTSASLMNMKLNMKF